MPKTCVVAYGRFNPVHKGHAMIFSTGASMQNDSTDFKIFISTSEGDVKNPLPYAVKVQMIDQYFPEFSQYISTAQGNTIFDILQTLDSQYSNVVLLCGSDRKQHFEFVLSRYNGTLYSFEDIQVHNLGERTDSLYSSTVMRQAVRDDDFRTFSMCLTDRADDLIYFNVLKTYMGVQCSDL